MNLADLKTEHTHKSQKMVVLYLVDQMNRDWEELMMVGFHTHVYITLDYIIFIPFNSFPSVSHTLKQEGSHDASPFENQEGI